MKLENLPALVLVKTIVSAEKFNWMPALPNSTWIFYLAKLVINHKIAASVGDLFLPIMDPKSHYGLIQRGLHSDISVWIMLYRNS